MLVRVREGFQVARESILAQLAQRLRFDLADTLAADGEPLADLLKRVIGFLTDAKTHPHDQLLARRKRRQYLMRQMVEITPDCCLDR